MKTLRTQEQQDGSHIVLTGRMGQYGPGDVIPADIAQAMQEGQPVEVGGEFVVAGKGQGVILAAGVDVQRDRIEAEVVGWTPPCTRGRG